MTTFYLCLIFAIYPLFISDGLFGLQKTKLTFFVFVSVIYMIYSLFHIKEWKFRKLDGYVVLFFIVLCLSTIFSISKNASIYGTMGRYHGLFLMSIYLLLYFCLSRSTYNKEIVTKSMLIGVSISASLGFLNVLGIDPLNIYPRIDPGQREFFISTLGNLDFYGAYQALMLGYFMSLKRDVYSILGVIFSAIGLASANVDGAMIAIAIYSLFVLYRGVKKDFLIHLSLFMTTLFLSLQILLEHGSLYNYSSLYEMLGQGIVYVLLMGGIYLIYQLSQHHVRLLVLGIFSTIVLGVVFFTFIYKEEIPSFLEIFRFNSAWGSYRGYLYEIAMNHYADFNLIGKLFGSGLETVPLLTANQEIMGGVFVDSYHCVYLQLLVTCGLFGLMSYLALLYGFFKEYGCLIWIIFIVIDLVSIWQVASTPFAFIFLFILKKEA